MNFIKIFFTFLNDEMNEYTARKQNNMLGTYISFETRCRKCNCMIGNSDKYCRKCGKKVR